MRKLLLTSLAIFLLALPMVAQAAGSPTPTATSAVTPSATQAQGSIPVVDPTALAGAQITPDGLLGLAIRIFLALISLFAFFGLLYSGFTYITSGGDPAKAALARKNIIWAIIGILIAILAYAMLLLVSQIIKEASPTESTPTPATSTPATN